MDALAWFISVVFYILVAMPIIGDTLAGGNNNYVDSLKTGATIHGFLLGLAGFVFSVVWAFMRITS